MSGSPCNQSSDCDSADPQSFLCLANTCYERCENVPVGFPCLCPTTQGPYDGNDLCASSDLCVGQTQPPQCVSKVPPGTR